MYENLRSRHLLLESGVCSGQLLLEVRCRAWRRAWQSSWEAPLATRGSRRRPVTPVGGVVSSVESTVLRA